MHSIDLTFLTPFLTPFLRTILPVTNRVEPPYLHHLLQWYNQYCNGFLLAVLLLKCEHRNLILNLFTIPAQHVETPYVMSKKKAGNMDYGSVVHLGCSTPNAMIHYTVDGVAPEMHKINIKVC